MSKAVVTIAALEATHDEPDLELRAAMQDAITRSDNCAIRRVILSLQQLQGKGLEGTMAAFDEVLGHAQVQLARAPQAAPAEQACVKYLEAHRRGLTGDVLDTVPEFGTAEWTVADAINFTHALTTGIYGQAGTYLLRLMGEPKQGPLEEPPPPHAPPLDWGAGAVFPESWRRAWKGGWGGSQDNPQHFLAGQIVALEVARRQIAAAAVYVPVKEPENDNPGITEAPRALELMFTAAKIGIEGELGI